MRVVPAHGHSCVEISAPTGIAHVRLDLDALCETAASMLALRFLHQKFCEGLAFRHADGSSIELTSHNNVKVRVEDDALEVEISGPVLSEMRPKGELFYVNQYR